MPENLEIMQRIHLVGKFHKQEKIEILINLATMTHFPKKD